MNAIRIGWITVRELIFERVFYLLIAFAAGAILLSLLLSQLTYTEQSKITLDFLLAGMEISVVLYAVFMSISLLHRELHQGSVFMVLSKPISRWSYLVGKFIGQSTVLAFIVLSMNLIIITLCSRFETFSGTAVLQSVLMIYFQGLVLSSITYLLAVNSGAITSALVSLCLFALGHMGSTVENNLPSSSATSWTIVKSLIPNLEIFNLKGYASYGISVAWSDIGWASLYGVTCLTFILCGAILCFNEKDIAGT